MKKRLLSLLLALLMCLTLLPAAALAEEPDPQSVDLSPVPGTMATLTTGGGEVDNDELFAGYLESKVFSVTPKKRGGYAVNPRLSGNDAIVYSVLRPHIEAVAAGTETSTQFEISPEAFYDGKTEWSAEDLGLTTLFVYNEAEHTYYISQAAVNAFSEKYAIDYDKVVDALRSDCPYSLYWFGNQVAYPQGYSIEPVRDGTTGEYRLRMYGNINMDFLVASDYHLNDNQFEVDPDAVNTAKSAAQKAQDFVAEKAALSDSDKLLAYKNKICDLVTYNDDAANGLVSGQNPWQLVWVFDEDPNTNVVCEGYSKAFKYLCDLSSFQEPVKCLTVSGKMDGGDHMWNLVSPGDGCNYLVDVTNCDGEGNVVSIGYPDKLFMNKNATGSVSTGYTFNLGNESTTYTYDKETLGLYETNELVIGQTQQGSAVLIKQAQASLDGTLAIRFTFTVPEGFSTEGALVRFNGSGRTLEVPFTAAAAVDGRDYSFDYPLAAREYRDSVTVRLLDKLRNVIPIEGASGTVYEDGLAYSLKTYVDKMKANENTSAAMLALADGIDAYCTAAQLYFGYNAEGLSVPAAVSAVTAEQLAGFAGVFSSDSLPQGITDRSIQLELVSDTVLRLTVYSDSSVAPEDYTFTVNGVQVYPERNANGSYYLDVTGISAPELDTVQTFSIAYGGVTYTVKASAMSYARAAVVNDGTGTRADLGRALYLYNSAANAYFQNANVG